VWGGMDRVPGVAQPYPLPEKEYAKLDASGEVITTVLYGPERPGGTERVIPQGMRSISHFKIV
jgi:hypothetical protein